MTIVDKRNGSAILARNVPAGQIFFIVVDDDGEYFIKIARERLRQVIKNEIEISKGEMNCDFAVRLSDGVVCKINSQAKCHIYPQAELIIKS